MEALSHMSDLPYTVLCLALVHALYLSLFHTLISFIPHYARVIWQFSTHNTGYAASIPSVTVGVHHMRS